jgi:chemotaxis protein MotB
MRKRGSDDEKQSGDRWLMTYSDMMNNLLVLFMVLYAMSIMDMSKFDALARELSNAFSDAPMTNSTVHLNYNELIPLAKEELEKDADVTLDEQKEQNKLDEKKAEFDKVYQIIKQKIKENGYEELLIVEKGEDFIKFRFGDNVLFYPDSPIIKNNDIEVLSFIGDILLEMDPLVQTIEIGGHTATTGEPTSSFFSWELSSQRSISVLKYLVQKCKLPESKMSISGYSRYHPIAGNDTEENRQLNRRVEIKITRVT